MNEDNGTYWIGIAVAADWMDMFWQVDEHGDPWQCEFTSINNGSVMVGLENDFDDPSLCELSESMIESDASVWKKIDWDKKIGNPHDLPQ